MLYNEGVPRNGIVLGRSDQLLGPLPLLLLPPSLATGICGTGVRCVGWMVKVSDVLRDWDNQNKITIDSFCGRVNYWD